MNGPAEHVVDHSVTLLQKIIDKVADFLVNYSFEVIGAVITLIVGLILAHWVAAVLARCCARKKIDITLTKFFAGALKLLILAFTITIALGKFGITITPLVAAGSALVFGGTFAFHGLLSNYGAGLSLLVARSFKVGDTITVTGVSGVVEEVKLACTVLSTGDGEVITIPNKHIVGEVLHNSFQQRVVESHIGISYAEDPERAIAIVQQALRTVPGVSQQPQPIVGIHEFADSSVNIGMRYWVPTRQFAQTAYAANLAVYHAITKAQITIPFPQRDVRITSQSAAL